METFVVDNENESIALSNINKYLEEKMFDKRKKEVCLVFSKKPSITFFKLVLLSFYDYKSAYLKMVKYEKNRRCNLEKVIIHNGEEIVFDEPKIIVGNVHKGAVLNIKTNLVFIGEIRGTIRLLTRDSSIYGEKFINATIIDKYEQKKIFNGEKYLLTYDELEG